jgi:hypothetical protein
MLLGTINMCVLPSRFRGTTSRRLLLSNSLGSLIVSELDTPSSFCETGGDVGTGTIDHGSFLSVNAGKCW